MQVILLPALTCATIHGLQISEGVLPVPPALGAYSYMHQLPPRANSGCLIPVKRRVENYSFIIFNLKAFPTTLTEESDIAAAAITGDSKMPKAGYSNPAAIGTPAAL